MRSTLRNFLSVAIAGGLAVGAGVAYAADHLDAPGAQAEPAADLTDLFAWTSSDASRLNLVLDVFPFAGAEAAFPTSVQYAFHVTSGPAFASTPEQVDVICQFYTVDRIECWAGDEYVEGDPSDPAGIVSQSGALRVFAGMRDDPFFFELAGFSATVDAVVAAAPSLTFDEAGCPDVPAEVAATLVDQLRSGAEGEPASDTFAGSNVLSLVVQVDTDVVATGGDVLGIWASTHAAQ